MTENYKGYKIVITRGHLYYKATITGGAFFTSITEGGALKCAKRWIDRQGEMSK